MYLPPPFREDRLEAQVELMAAQPLATVVSLGGDGLVASHVPLLWDPEPRPLGTLRGHFARPNPHGRVAASGVETLAIFVGPSAYVSPGWYPSKREHGKVVPTWNYVAVHAQGRLAIVDDRGWLREHVTRLSATHESFAVTPWRSSDAPEDFLEAMLRGIVGIELPLARLEGKWKLGQNRCDADRAGTIAGLTGRGDPASLAVAAAMRGGERSQPHPGPGLAAPGRLRGRAPVDAAVHERSESFDGGREGLAALEVAASGRASIRRRPACRRTRDPRARACTRRNRCRIRRDCTVESSGS